MTLLVRSISWLTGWSGVSLSPLMANPFRAYGRSPLNEAVQTKEALAAMLRGQKMSIPNLELLLSNLAAGSCSQFKQLEARIASRFDEILIYPEAREKADRINMPLFISVWFPNCGLVQQEAMALYNLWLFIWDDVFDGEDNKSTLLVDMDDMFERTIVYVRYHLGLDEASAREPAPPTWATSLFKHAGKLLVEHATLEQRQRFFAEVRHYIESCAYEQKVLDKDVLPTREEYWAFRWGTSSVYTACALTDFMASVEIPPELFETYEMRAIWTEVNRNVILINDILSLKKEIHGSLNSLAPITMVDTGKTLDASVEDIVGQLQLSIETFSVLSKKLLAMVKDNAQATQDVATYIKLLEYNMTGNYFWSIDCKRYNIAEYLRPDGTFLVQL